MDPIFIEEMLAYLQAEADKQRMDDERRERERERAGKGY